MQSRVIAYVDNQKQHHEQGTIWPSLEFLEDDDTEDDIKAQNS